MKYDFLTAEDLRLLRELQAQMPAIILTLRAAGGKPEHLRPQGLNNQASEEFIRGFVPDFTYNWLYSLGTRIFKDIAQSHSGGPDVEDNPPRLP